MRGCGAARLLDATCRIPILPSCSRRWTVGAVRAIGQTTLAHWPSLAALDLGRQAGITGLPELDTKGSGFGLGQRRAHVGNDVGYREVKVMGGFVWVEGMYLGEVGEVKQTNVPKEVG